VVLISERVRIFSVIYILASVSKINKNVKLEELNGFRAALDVSDNGKSEYFFKLLGCQENCGKENASK
jgi:hypothetical protein